MKQINWYVPEECNNGAPTSRAIRYRPETLDEEMDVLTDAAMQSWRELEDELARKPPIEGGDK